MLKDASALPLDGFQQVGAIVPDPNGLHCRMTGCTLLPDERPCPAVYAMVVGTTVMKVGITKISLEERIRGEAWATNYHLKNGTDFMASGKRKGKVVTEAYKILSPLVVRALKTVIIWAKPWDVTLLDAEENRLIRDYDPPWTGPVSPEKTRVTESVCLSATSIGTISGLAADPDWVEPVQEPMQAIVLTVLHFVKLYAGSQTCYTPSGTLTELGKVNFPQDTLPRDVSPRTVTNPHGFPSTITLFASKVPGGTFCAYKRMASNGGRHGYQTPAGICHIDTAGVLPVYPQGFYVDVALQRTVPRS